MDTYRKILDYMIDAREAVYRSDPERREATLAAMGYALQVTLEKLAEEEDRKCV